MEQHSISSDLIRGHIDTIILYSLLESDKYAQQISDSIDLKSNNEYQINQATLYSSLKRLESLKYVTSYRKDADNGRRKFFHLTEKGTQIVNDNLFGWNYSKNIIDKLMGCEIQSVQEPKIIYVEKQVEMVKPTQPIISTPEEPKKEENLKNSNVQSQFIEHKPVESAKIINKDQADVNFRSILNNLIASKKHVDSKPVLDDVKSISEEKASFNEIEKLNLNDTLINSDFNSSTASYNSKIDFGDLKIKANQEGYKIRISSKNSAITEGYVKINKLNMWSAIILLIVCIAEFLPVYLLNSNILRIHPIVLGVFIFALLSFPVYTIVKRFYGDEKHIPKLYNDSIFTCAIVVFNLLLVNLAITFLANMDFSIKANLIKFIYLPAVLTLDSLLYMIIRYALSKNKLFYNQKK